MEQPNMFPVTINEELFRILFPSVKEAANASGTNAIMGLLTDSCYALLLYKPVPGSAADKPPGRRMRSAPFFRRRTRSTASVFTDITWG